MTDSFGAGLAMLSGATGISLGMGWHMAASIGGADMPVVITLLNRFFFILFRIISSKNDKYFFISFSFLLSHLSPLPVTPVGLWSLKALCSTMICWLLSGLLSDPPVLS